MASFYGNGYNGSSSSAGGGTKNYNELTNRPIKNLIGLTAIDLSLLETGLYSIKGNYIYIASDTEVKTFANNKFLEVFLDEELGTKVITFKNDNQGKHYQTYISYDINLTTYTVEQFSYDNFVTCDTETSLPEEGDSTTLYTTEDGIYVYNSSAQGYVKLGTATGEQLWEGIPES
jgi:hypothetical protein